MAESQNLLAARAYAALGWHVFPVSHRDKRPLSAHGFHDATTDLAQIDRWWGDGSQAGIGIATGPVSGLVVVDIDPRNGGDEALAALEAQFAAFPATIESATGGGGRHIFFMHPAPGDFAAIPSAKPWPGIDIKSTGGYVVAPYSTHPNGLKYHWKADCDPLDLQLAPIPQWLTEHLTKHPPRNAPQEPSEASERTFSEGERNDALASLAGTMRRRGMAPASILSALLEENKSRCLPPLSESEVATIAASVGRYTPDKDSTPGKLPAFSFQFADVLSMIQDDPPPIDWLLEGWLAKGDCSILVGAPYVGKSWVTLDLALTQALGLPTLGHFASTPRRVLVVDEENPADEVWRRLRMLCTAWDVKNSKAADGHLFIAQPCQGFSFREETAALSLMEQVNIIRPDLIIFDSLIAISDVRDENSAIEVRRFFHDRLYPLRSICGSTVLSVHHTSKAVYNRDRDVADEALPRGSIDMLGAPDSAFLLNRSTLGAGYLKLDALKVRRGERPKGLVLSIVPGDSGGARPLVRSVDRRAVELPHASQEARESLLGVLQDQGEITFRNLLAQAHLLAPQLNERQIRYALTTLQQGGRVEIDGEGMHRTVRVT